MFQRFIQVAARSPLFLFKAEYYSTLWTPCLIYPFFSCFLIVVNAGALRGCAFPALRGVCLGAGVLGLRVTGIFLARPDFLPKWLPPLRPTLHFKLRREKNVSFFSHLPPGAEVRLSGFRVARGHASWAGAFMSLLNGLRQNLRSFGVCKALVGSGGVA